jgi:acyl dehydratase
MGLAELTGRSYGPRPLPITPDRVSDFVELTGDDAARWVLNAPPGFAAAALFEVAPELLDEMSDHSVIHGEQSFTWHGPLVVGASLEVTGTVARIRQRGGVNYVDFDVMARDGGGPVVEGNSLFLVSGEAVPVESGFERPEPPHSYRGEPLPGQRAASRADLVRYASATRDWNPIHWDHDAAVTAGLPGVITHGLLQAAWALAEASRHGRGPSPLGSARIRFRNPLLPARPVSLSTEADGQTLVVTISDQDHEYLSARVELSDE